MVGSKLVEIYSSKDPCKESNLVPAIPKWRPTLVPSKKTLGRVI